MFLPALRMDTITTEAATPFLEFPKMARLSRQAIVTEKIDGTNAQICIVELADSAVMPTHTPIVAVRGNKLIYAGSRSRWITPTDDNFGFAAWVCANADALVELGVGRHFGEWWGSGVQRGYGIAKGEKRFSLFNVSRWDESLRDAMKHPTARPACCGVVPILGIGDFDSLNYGMMLAKLAAEGSQAAPGFMKPEGIVIYHTAGGIGFKKTIEKDDVPKSLAK